MTPAWARWDWVALEGVMVLAAVVVGVYVLWTWRRKRAA